MEGGGGAAGSGAEADWAAALGCGDGGGELWVRACRRGLVSVATLHVPLVAMEGDMWGSIPIEATDSQ